MKLKKKQKKAICEYVRYCANEMGLRDWTLEISFTDSPMTLSNVDDHDGDEGVLGATCDPVSGRKYAEIMFGPALLERLLDGDRDQFRVTVAHELVHCHFAPLWEQMRMDLWNGRLMDQTTYSVFIASAERNMEFGVDAMGEAIAPRLPLIDLPE